MAFKKYKPQGNKMLVLPLKKKADKMGDIIIPESVNAQLSEGLVVEVAPDLEDRYKVGDKVLFPTGAGAGDMYEGKPHVWLDGGAINVQADIWAIVIEDE